MKKPKRVKQMAEHLCGPACLESLLDFYGLGASQEELAKLCGSTPEEGTDPSGLRIALEHFGLSVEERCGTWEDLIHLTQAGKLVLVGYFSDFLEPGDEHYSLAYEVTDRSVWIMDPEVGEYREIDKGSFLKSWKITPPENWCLVAKLE